MQKDLVTTITEVQTVVCFYRHHCLLFPFALNCLRTLLNELVFDDALIQESLSTSVTTPDVVAKLWLKVPGDGTEARTSADSMSHIYQLSACDRQVAEEIFMRILKINDSVFAQVMQSMSIKQKQTTVWIMVLAVLSLAAGETGAYVATTMDGFSHPLLVVSLFNALLVLAVAWPGPGLWRNVCNLAFAMYVVLPLLGVITYRMAVAWAVALFCASLVRHGVERSKCKKKVQEK